MCAPPDTEMFIYWNWYKKRIEWPPKPSQASILGGDPDQAAREVLEKDQSKWSIEDYQTYCHFLLRKGESLRKDLIKTDQMLARCRQSRPWAKQKRRGNYETLSGYSVITSHKIRRKRGRPSLPTYDLEAINAIRESGDATTDKEAIEIYAKNLPPGGRASAVKNLTKRFSKWKKSQK